MLSSCKGKVTMQEWSSRKASDRWRKRDSQGSDQKAERSREEGDILETSGGGSSMKEEVKLNNRYIGVHY